MWVGIQFLSGPIFIDQHRNNPTHLGTAVVMVPCAFAVMPIFAKFQYKLEFSSCCSPLSVKFNACLYIFFQLKCQVVVEAYIQRIKEVNDLLNAVVSYRFNEALDEAEHIDEMLDSGDVPARYSEKNAPFLGVPLTVKEAFSVIG